MLNKYMLIAFSLIALFIIFILKTFLVYSHDKQYFLTSAAEIPSLFPRTPAQIERLVRSTKTQATANIEKICSISAAEKTFANTAIAYDTATAIDFSIPCNILTVISMTHPNEDMRDSARNGLQELQNFAVDTFNQNIDIYNAFVTYIELNRDKNLWNAEEAYYLTELIKGFERSGLKLPAEKRAAVKSLIKAISDKTLAFDKNINDDASSIKVTREQLAGMDQEYIDRLDKTDDGLYIVRMDYPTYTPIMMHCTVAQTRRDALRAFNNRAYPANIAVLNDIVNLRDELASQLSFASYAAYNLDDEMVKTPERAESFVKNVATRAQTKAKKEATRLTSDLPESVQLVDGKIQPWDWAFLEETYKKKHYNIDQREIARYFPATNTTAQLLRIYELFFDLEFHKESVTGLWDKEVSVISVKRKDHTEPIGYLLLDLYPRPNKYSHACEITVIPTTTHNDVYRPGLAVVIANFPKPTATQDGLLLFSDVKTFFHEFGHAIHALLGSTEMAGFSGTSVKRDFVEMPSQMLEEWMYDRAILKIVSSHVDTKEPLPDELIDKIIELKKFTTGHWVARQSSFALLALDYYKTGRNKDLLGIMRTDIQFATPYLNIDPENHFPASFGHLTDYGAGYYSYLWSKVFALDLFAYINKQGLLNPIIGKKYAHTILAPGGSIEPDQLLKNFLGREPSNNAFFEDLGL